MSLLHAIFGAKPAFGTPPFAPAPMQTGGADNVPAPGAPQHGIAGFLDRVFNPTNGLGQFGQALVAAGGNPAQAMAYMMQQRAAAGEPAAKFNEWRQQYDYENAHPKATAASSFDQELAANGIMPGTDAYAKAHQQHLNNELDPIVSGQSESGPFFVPRSQLNMIPGAVPVGGAPPGVLGADLPPGWTVQGGAGGNTSGNFRR